MDHLGRIVKEELQERGIVVTKEQFAIILKGINSWFDNSFSDAFDTALQEAGIPVNSPES